MAKTLLNEPKAGTHSEAGHQARLPRCWFDEPMVEAAGVEPAARVFYQPPFKMRAAPMSGNSAPASS